MQNAVLGKTGIEISKVIFGSIICMEESQSDANHFVSYALDAGVNCFDAAPSYGNSEEKLGPALKGRRNGVILNCKTTERTAKGVMESLESSLKTLQTDYFDVYQIHALANSREFDQIFAENGAIEAFIEAKKKGLIRHIGITAHSEELALEAISKFDFDTAMFPLN